MSRRPRSNVIFNYSNKPNDVNQKTIDEQLNEFLNLFTLNQESKLEIDKKIEFLKNFLKSFRTQFKSLSNSQNDLTNYAKKFINQLEVIAIPLILNIIQLDSPKLRTLSLRFILYLSHFPEFNAKFQSLNINIYLIRLIDLKITTEDVCLSVEYIRLLAQLYPNCINKAIIHTLISAIEDPRAKTNFFLIETLIEIICIKPILACECKVFDYLLDFILNVSPEQEYCIEVIMQSLVKTCEQPECRKLINLHDLFSQLISPLVDSDYSPLIYRTQKETEVEFETKIENVINSSITAISTLMKSYNGIMLLSINEGKILKVLFSPLSWFLKANKRNIDKKLLFNSKDNERQLLILTSLIDFLYRLTSIDKMSDDLLKSRKSSSGRSMSISFNSYNFLSLIEDDFVNQECECLFEPMDSFTSQSNLNNLTLEHKISIYSTSPNLSITYKAFLLKLLAEIGVFESLLDLYFGLPLSFLETYTLIPRTQMDSNSNDLIYKFEILSIKTLNLFAELYYMINTILFNEYCIDDFTQDDLNSGPYSSEKSVYNEMKKLSLVSYMKELNFLEREKEVIMYITEFSQRKEMLKNGLQIQSDKMSNLCFYSQQFLANSGFLNSKKFQIEMNLINTNLYRADSDEENFGNNSLSLFGRFFSKNEVDFNLEDQLSRQIDLTLILQFESNLNQLNDTKTSWNWYEIVKFFEIYLLVDSSFHSRFSPSQYAIELNGNKSKYFAENKKFQKFFKKLFHFFTKFDQIQNVSQQKTSLNSSRISYSSLTSNPQSNINFDLIACSGCYLIDFCLNNRQIDQSYINNFILNIKKYVTHEFTNSKSQLNSLSSENGKSLAKDSVLGLYILFIAHLTSIQLGDQMLEKLEVYDILVEIIEKSKDMSLMKLILSTFNFYQSKKSRLIFEKSLTIGSFYESRNKELIFQYNDFKFYALKLILNLFRANNLKFEVFYVKIILASLYSLNLNYLEKESDDVKASLTSLIEFIIVQIEYYLNLRPDFVEELMTETSNLENFMNNFLVQNSKVVKIKIKFLIFRLKFCYLNIRNLECEKLENLVKEWYINNLDKYYYRLIELKLFDYYALNHNYSHEIDDRYDYECIDEEEGGKKTDNNKSFKIYRRTNDLVKNYSYFMSSQSQIFLPFHINTALARLIDKPNFKCGFFDEKTTEQLKLLKYSVDDKVKNTKKLKSALWSLCSLCISEEGFKYVSKLSKNIFKNLFDFASTLIKLAEDHSHLSVRSTSFLCLNLISKSCTGANLIGKLGWHTFQPNRLTPTRAFYCLLSSLSKEEQELSVYSSIDTAIILYNLNRYKSSLCLKRISKFFDCDLSNYEIEYLSHRNLVYLEKLDDREFIKIFDKNKIGINFENLTVPVRVSLMSVNNEVDLKYCDEIELPKRFKCDSQSCLKCYIKSIGPKKLEVMDEKSEEILVEIMKKIDIICPMVKFDESLKKLHELKKTFPASFDICLYSYVISNYFSVFRLKYKLRKSIQELFIDLNF